MTWSVLLGLAGAFLVGAVFGAACSRAALLQQLYARSVKVELLATRLAAHLDAVRRPTTKSKGSKVRGSSGMRVM